MIIIAISNEDPKLVKKFAKYNKDMVFPVAADVGGKLWKAYGIGSIPAYFVIDGNGKIVYRGEDTSKVDAKLSKAVDAFPWFDDFNEKDAKKRLSRAKKLGRSADPLRAYEGYMILKNIRATSPRSNKIYRAAADAIPDIAKANLKNDTGKELYENYYATLESASAIVEQLKASKGKGDDTPEAPGQFDIAQAITGLHVILNEQPDSECAQLAMAAMKTLESSMNE